MFTPKGNRRTPAHKAESMPGENERSNVVRKRKLALPLAAAAAASLSAMIAAPAHATTTVNGYSVLPLAPIVVELGSSGHNVDLTPYGEQEIRTLQQLGDHLGAYSRITANGYASGNMYQSS